MPGSLYDDGLHKSAPMVKRIGLSGTDYAIILAIDCQKGQWLAQFTQSFYSSLQV
jgi:hypothetical protein